MRRTAAKTLVLPARVGARVVARALLDDAVRAADAYSAHAGQKELHAFRVALRRLRTWLRTFQAELHGDVRRKDRHRLRDIAAATNLGRDTDVQLAWLREASHDLSRTRKRGARWLSDYVRARQRDIGDPLDAALLDDFVNTSRELASRVSNEPLKAWTEGDVTLAHVLARRIVFLANELADALAGVRAATDELQAHEARIAAKRLRYVLEHAAPSVTRGPELLERLKTLQDDLGALHDAHVMGHLVRAAVASSERLDGVLAIADRLRAETDGLFERVHAHWRRGRVEAFRRGVEQFARRLERVAA